MSVNEYDMPLLRPEPERDRFGRYVLPKPGGGPESARPFTRTTTLAKALDDTYNLNQWSKRMLVQGLKIKPELLDSVDLSQDDRQLRDVLQGVADDAHEASGAGDAAARGTQLHYFTEAVDVGAITVDQVPTEYRREVAAYRAAMAKHGIQVAPSSVERIVLNPDADTVGTADRLPVVFPDGTAMVADVKSGRDLSYGWGAIAMQLATYANAAAMLEYDEDGNPYWSAMPDVSREVGLVMHTPVDSGKCDLYLLDLTAGYDAIELALEVRRYRQRKDLAHALPLGKYGMAPAPQETGVYAGTSMEAVHPSDTATLDAAAERLAPPAGDPFSDHPDAEPVTVNTEALAFNPPPAAPAADENDTDALLARLRDVKDATARAYKASGRKRRSPAMSKADKAAVQAETAIPNADLLRQTIADLETAYAVVMPVAEPDASPEAEAAAVNESRPAPEPEKAAEYPLADVSGNPFAPSPVEETTSGRTASGTLLGRNPGEDLETFARRLRYVEAGELVEAASSADELGALYTQYADVWSDYLTNRGQSRLVELGRTAQTTTTEPQRDPILVLLDQCSTQEEMGQVYAANAAAWTDEYTQYGMSVLASK